MIEKDIFEISSSEAFEKAALAVFQYQYQQVKVYRDYCNFLKVSSEEINKLEQIPFLPIQFFKTHKVITENKSVEVIFTSSGTSGTTTSKHYVANADLYRNSFIKGFQNVYGPIEDWTILALLPSYLEREGSSLIFMVDEFIQRSDYADSGFYLHDLKGLTDKLLQLETEGRKTLLIGVSYALLDLIETRKFKLKHTLVMETGGMKGRRKELIKEALHEILKEGFDTKVIHSEYGMTELLSQAYAVEGGIFKCPPWMKILTRDTEDPFTYLKGKTGGINVIDLANLYSCSFIATQDLGRLNHDGSFEIIGRFDQSDIRGCNLMVL
jgi:phenylacetate-coenzyme A ligase PaaK-like adenylate-forming protein